MTGGWGDSGWADWGFRGQRHTTRQRRRGDIVIARSVLGAVGRAVDWSLIRVLGAVSDRVEGRGADCYRRADALADMEAGREVWERGELDGRGSAASDAVRGVPVLCVEHLHGPHVDVRPVDPCECVCATCVSGGHCDTASCAQIPDDFEATEYLRWPEPYVPPLPEPAAHGFSGECPDAGSSCGCGRSAAVTTPAADNTTTVDHLEAAWNYHRISTGYDSTNRKFIWTCEGCNWSGPTEQAHARHRFHVLADMKNATHRIQEQLGGAS